jgi:hypothetical protein
LHAENQAPISKNVRARFKNACGTTDRFQKNDNVEIDDSAKIAGREMVMRNDWLQCIVNARAAHIPELA